MRNERENKCKPEGGEVKGGMEERRERRGVG